MIRPEVLITQIPVKMKFTEHETKMFNSQDQDKTKTHITYDF